MDMKMCTAMLKERYGLNAIRVIIVRYHGA